MDATEALLVGLGIGSLSVILVIAIVLYILQVIGYWKLFKKLGEPGWKSIIPFYNYYIEIKYVWNPKWFWIVMGVAVLGGIVSGFGEDGSAVAFIGNGITAVSSIICLIETYKLSKSFGHGCGWFIGLVFLKSIFTIMLGFGKSEYVGNAGDEIPGLDRIYPKPEKEEEKTDE